MVVGALLVASTAWGGPSVRKVLQWNVNDNLIPEQKAEALPADKDVGVVYVVNDGAVERRSVKLGTKVAGGQIVLSGLNSGARLAVGDLSRLADGAKVRLAN